MIRRLRDDDWRIYWGKNPPPEMFGLAYEKDNTVLWMGGLFWMWDRWWATFKCWEDVTPTSVHRWSIKLIQAAREAGIEQVWCETDPNIERAVPWVKRHGFVFDHTHDNGIEVWRLDLGSSSRSLDRRDSPDSVRPASAR